MLAATPEVRLKSCSQDTPVGTVAGLVRDTWLCGALSSSEDGNSTTVRVFLSESFGDFGGVLFEIVPELFGLDMIQSANNKFLCYSKACHTKIVS